MNKKEIACFFVFYSILGWFIDSLARTMHTFAWTTDNMLGIPLSPTYGFGALGFLFLYTYIRHWKWWRQFLLYAVLSAMYEYSVAVISIWFLGRRLWDYHYVPLDINGHTDPFHALIWGALAMLVTHWLHPRLQSLFCKARVLKKIPAIREKRPTA